MKPKLLKQKLISLRIFKIEMTVLTVLALVILYQVMRYVPAVKDAVAMATTVKPETFTEMWFEDHINLPKTIVKYKTYSFTFTLHNVEFKNMNYRYEVYVQRGNVIVPIEEGNLNIRADETKSKTVEFGPLKSLRSKIVVNLKGKNQQIDFWMEP